MALHDRLQNTPHPFAGTFIEVPQDTIETLLPVVEKQLHFFRDNEGGFEKKFALEALAILKKIEDLVVVSSQTSGNKSNELEEKVKTLSSAIYIFDGMMSRDTYIAKGTLILACRKLLSLTASKG